jgi:hypothetical protein
MAVAPEDREQTMVEVRGRVHKLLGKGD